MPGNGPIIHFPTEEEEQSAPDEFAREMQRVKERKESVSTQKLQEALETISDYLQTGWSTGGGRRLRQFVWSLWNGYHLLNLYGLSSGLDGRRTDAVIVIFRAAMVGALTEDPKRRVLARRDGRCSRKSDARVPFSTGRQRVEQDRAPAFPVLTSTPFTV